MKTLFFALLVSGSLFAQETNSEKMNIVKTNVTAYAFRNVNLTYERILSKKFSIAASYGTVSKGKIPFSSSILKDTEFSDTQVGLSHFTIEPRIYFGQGYGRGFYLAPYYRHTTVNADNVTLNVDFATDTVPMKIAGKATGNSGGLMLGVQWFLGKTDSWILDFWIIGAHYGKGKGDFRGNSARPLTAEEQAQVRKEIEDLDSRREQCACAVNIQDLAQRNDAVEKAPVVRGLHLHTGLVRGRRLNGDVIRLLESGRFEHLLDTMLLQQPADRLLAASSQRDSRRMGFADGQRETELRGSAIQQLHAFACGPLGLSQRSNCERQSLLR